MRYHRRSGLSGVSFLSSLIPNVKPVLVGTIKPGTAPTIVPQAAPSSGFSGAGILVIGAVGVAGYLLYRHFRKPKAKE